MKLKQNNKNKPDNFIFLLKEKMHGMILHNATRQQSKLHQNSPFLSKLCNTCQISFPLAIHQNYILYINIYYSNFPKQTQLKLQLMRKLILQHRRIFKIDMRTFPMPPREKKFKVYQPEVVNRNLIFYLWSLKSVHN